MGNAVLSWLGKRIASYLIKEIPGYEPSTPPDFASLERSTGPSVRRIGARPWRRVENASGRALRAYQEHGRAIAGILRHVQTVLALEADAFLVAAYDTEPDLAAM